MNKSKIFLVLVVAFIIGIGTRSIFVLDGTMVFLLLGIFSIITLSVFWKNKIIIIAVGMMLFFGLGILRTDGVLEKISNISETKNFSGSALVIREPEKKDFYQNIIAKHTKITLRS